MRKKKDFGAGSAFVRSVHSRVKWLFVGSVNGWINKWTRTRVHG